MSKIHYVDVVVAELIEQHQVDCTKAVDLLTELSEALKEVPDIYQKEAFLRFEDDGDDEGTRLELVYLRPETIEEAAKREADSAERARLRAERKANLGKAQPL